MSENQPINEVAVDRRAETVTTQQPGYAATEQVTRDVAAERRQGLFQITRIVYTILGILEILLGIRFVLQLIGANAASGFATFIYGITGVFVAPFNGLIGTPASGGIDLRSDHPHCDGRLCAALLGDRARDPDRGRSTECPHRHALDA